MFDKQSTRHWWCRVGIVWVGRCLWCHCVFCNSAFQVLCQYLGRICRIRSIKVSSQAVTRQPLALPSGTLSLCTKGPLASVADTLSLTFSVLKGCTLQIWQQNICDISITVWSRWLYFASGYICLMPKGTFSI